MGDEMILPDNMTEEEVLNIVRDLMGEDMTDQDLRNAYNSGCFKELCPDIVNYAAGNKPSDDGHEAKSAKKSEEPRPGPSKNKDERKPEFHSKSSKNKGDADSESESIASIRNSHHKKKKKKHSKDHKRDKDHKKDRDKEHDERKEKHKSTASKEVQKPKPQPQKVVELSDSEDERRKKEHLKKEKKRVVIISSSDSESDRERSKHKKEQLSTSKEISKKDHSDIKDEKPKVHPFYQDKSNEPGVNQPSSKVPEESKQEKTVEKKKEPKPFSKYSTYVSQVNLRKWRPFLHKEHLKYQRKFRLKPVSVVCVDLLDFPMVFHDPRKHSKNPNAVPLLSGVGVSDTRLEMIRRLERDKTNWFKKKLNKRALKCLIGGKNKRMSDSSDDDRHHKRARIIDRIVSSSDTNSDSSSVMLPNKKPKKDMDNHRSGKMSKAEREAEAKRRKLEDLKRKVDRFSKKGTRLLPWENKDAYFNSKKKDDPLKEKEKILADKRKRQEESRKQRMEQQKNAPTVSFQRILKQIETANKEQANKPKVQLKIPRKNQNPNRPVPMNEYKLDGRIGVGDVYKEVTKLLSSNVLVECPVMAGPGDDLGEYTVKKISWWLLKNEKEPAEIGAYHPECHDDDDMDSVHSDDFEWPDDVSSIVGCVSDPEGLAADVPPDPKKVQDPDWADDYCGEASLYARIRKETKDATKNVGLDSVENMRSFLRTKPGTNYSKPNFEVKCFICNELLKGQRQFGAHIRSDSHKNNFRNYSLDMANYEENVEIPEPKKYYVAKLVEYSVDSSTGNNNTTATSRTDESVETKHEVAKIERVRSDSPGPIVGGDAAPNIMVQEMPIPDDISLPSIQNYDISSDESLQNVRVALRTTDRWNDDLERKWRTWKDEEAKIAEEYNGERDFFIMEPERHPSYEEEWLKYWDQKCAELEAQGIDTENYNFHKDWMGVWLTRMQEIMMEKVEQRVAELKKSLGIDKHTLRSRYNISKEATRRKKLKKRGKKTVDDDLCSSVKSTGKVGSSSANGPQPVQPSALHQRNNNNVHNSKPECLPTPPVTDEDRNNRKIVANGDRGGSPPPKEIKSEDRSKHDRHEKRHRHDDEDRRRDRRKDDHRRHRDKYYDDKDRRSKSRDHKHSNDKHDHRDRDRHEKRHRKDDKHSSRDDRRHRDDKYSHKDKKDNKLKEEKDILETVSPQSLDNLESAQNENVKKENKSECSISSAEPPPPGVEPMVLDSNGKSGRPTPPVISDRYSSKVKEMNERIDTELRIKLETRNEFSNPKPESPSHHSKLNENSNSSSNDPARSKNDWSCDSSDETKDKPDNNSVVSAASITSEGKNLQDRLKLLREQLALTEESTTTGKRPKVIPLEKTNNKNNLEDGEVGSDISDLSLTASKGVSTFVNKVIPGRADLNLGAASTDTNNLSKNSIGYHLLERKKSLDESSCNSNDRSKHERRDGNKSYKDKEVKHEKSRGHSSKHDDRDRSKYNHKSGFKDDRGWRDNKDNRNKSNRGHNNHGRGGNRNVSKRGGAHNQPFGSNQSHYTNNVPVPVTPSFADDSWEPEESWEPDEQLPTPVPLFPPVPDNSSHIPVLDSTRPQQHHQPYSQPQPLFHPQQLPWDNGGGWGQGYPPQTGYNNY